MAVLGRIQDTELLPATVRDDRHSTGRCYTTLQPSVLRLGKKAFRNEVVVVPLLKEALPRAILVFPLVMVEEPRDVVLLPLEIEEFPRAIRLFPLFMVVLPRERAVFPSVKLVLPIEEKLVFLTQIRRRGSGLTRSEASHTHAARPALRNLTGNSNISCNPERTRMLSVDSTTPVSHNALVELVDVGSGRPHTTHVSL
ncbi:unnamed protein product [Pleuronectes platessa]|uniref:Uncharacterized protein n=1 Tax=Pleuronectes platessa TaxID=8262 RepID=A0A9N7UV21_PLEPL|nr:unnamed protein product [Pleuronectes platessa]